MKLKGLRFNVTTCDTFLCDNLWHLVPLIIQQTSLMVMWHHPGSIATKIFNDPLLHPFGVLFSERFCEGLSRHARKWCGLGHGAMAAMVVGILHHHHAMPSCHATIFSNCDQIVLRIFPIGDAPRYPKIPLKAVSHCVSLKNQHKNLHGLHLRN
jgi:hypothetical protein